MGNTKNKEILTVYNAYWDAYLKGDMKTFSSLLDKNVHIIGSTEYDVFHDKKSAVEFYSATADQISGKAKMRNRDIEVLPHGENVMVQEQCDFYFSDGIEWKFYGHMRASTLLKKDREGWKVIHQHGSLPDAKAEEGEQLATEKIKKENLNLRDAIKRRTAELEFQKNELAIEAALERVRAVAMGMTKPEDLLGICKVLFKEFKGLGFKNLRNTMVNLHDDQTKSLDNYDYSGKLKGSVTRIEYDSHPATKNIVRQLKKSSNAFGSFSLKGKKLDEWRDYRKSLGEKDDPLLNTANILSYYFYSIGTGSIGISSYSLLGTDQITFLERFRNVFELAYRRFTDIQKAEEQVRESQIEAGLERVRASAMAMHQSDELQKVIQVIFDQLSSLGLSLDSAQFDIFEEGSNDINGWIATPEYQYAERIKTPYFKSPLMDTYKEAKSKKSTTYTMSFSKTEKDNYWRYVFKNTDLSKIPAKRKKYLLSRKGLDQTGAILEDLSLSINNYQGKHYSEADTLIIKRFAEVFQQAYTRFLDLQKAEAQAYEAQIETALEHVRARTMAMKHSDELPEAANLLFLQVQSLGINAWSAGYNILSEDKKSSLCVMSSEGVMQTAFRLPFIGEKSFKEWHKAIKKGDEFFVQEIGGQPLIEHYEYLMNLPGVKEAVAPIEAAGYSLPTYQINHLSFFKQGFLLFITYEPVPEAHDLFKRFSAVFEQTYTRFLDLQKAEAQAREAQIEAALERVRASSMAMHKTQDIADVVVVFFEQLKFLDVQFVQSWINVVHPEEGSIDVWFSPLEGVYNEPAFFKIPLALFENTTVKSWKAGETFSYVSFKSKKELNALFKACDKATNSNYFGHLQKKLQLERLEFLDANYKFGAVSKSGVDKATPEEEAILHRFAKVFEQTYTRFLDLKKAEAQAREAEIEAALERVRSRSMGMQRSEELQEVILLIYDQMSQLGVSTDSVQVEIYREGSEDINVWVANEFETYGSEIAIKDLGFDIVKNFLKDRRAGKEDHFFRLEKRAKDRYYDKAFKESDFKFLPEEKKKLIRRGDFLTVYAVFMKKTGLQYVAFDRDDFTSEDKKILKRFSEVFDQFYIRFLDLQTAEAQAKEAQIEAALEKVRSRSLAMQKSEELADLSLELVKQVQALGEATWFCAFNIYDDDPRGSLEWGSNGEGTFPKYRTPREGVFLRYYNAGQKGKKILINEIGPEECPAHYDYLCSLPGVGDQLLKMKDNGIPFPDSQIDHVAFFKHGYVLFITYDPVPELHDVFKRFAKVFEQSYTRFLDLQKAEAQAREAQIEAALERVRAKSMAMHTSENLLDTISEFFTQLKLLDVVPVRCGVAQMLTTPPSWIWTATNATTQGDSVQASGLLTNLGHPVLQSIYDNWVDQENYFPVLKGKDLRDYYKVLRGELTIPEFTRGEVHYGHYFNFKEGNIFAWTTEPLRSEEVTIFERFSLVLSLTYRRYLDLQTAESQAKEAQIEAALERVRASSMAMHASEELKEVVRVIFDQMTSLDINAEHTGIVVDYQPKTDWHFWIAETQDIPAKVSVPYLDIVWDRQFTKAKKNGEDFFTTQLDFEQKNKFYAKLLPHIKGLTRKAKNFYMKCPGLAISTSIQKDVAIYIENFSGTPYTDEENLILQRFTKVFQQTYTRFLDLQKAEAQAREAQIEAALDRIRARSMAMHSSDELVEASDVMISELNKLNINALRVGICTIDAKSGSSKIWSRSEVKGKLENKILGIVPEGAHLVFDNMVMAWKKGESYFTSTREGDEVKDYYDSVSVYLSYPKPKKLNIKETISAFFFKEGSLNVVSLEPLSEDDSSIMIRFASVFDQTYTRFLDLQKAEAQARESQIELALERIRSQATAMKVSTDLLDIVVTMRTEFVGLGHEAHYFWHMRYLPENYEKAMTSGDGTKIGMVMELPRHIHGDIPLIAEWEKSKRPTVVYAMDPDTAVDYINKMITLGDFKQIDPQAPDPEDLRELGGYTFVMARTTHGEIGFSLPGIVSTPPQESIDTIIRFASVFDLAYRRFEDLLAAEAQANEAVKQSSLDRVRAEIASMRKTEDLERITPLLWKELGILGVPFFRCGVFIVNEQEEMVHAYLSNPSGASLAALHLSFDDPDIALVGSTIKHWKLQTPYLEEWTKAQFIESTQLFLQKGQIKDSTKFQAGERPPEKLVLQLVPFKQGMLYAGSEIPLIEEHIDLMRDLADAFAVAYARYEDFVKLEEAKKKVEYTLTDLKSAQSQLVHAEKMASLGELTAGIAHEIQNPLNFVNNFSEVNKELMEELKEELLKGDYEEAKAIAQDILDNDAKIMHHGKRAEGIVKGMLQHSRTSSGEKELTDINVLADEYLRLAYHGLRAKDKSFNADFELNLDENLPKVNVVPQDIGRVLLNLINNAFHAVSSEAKAKEGSEYKPKVVVTTKASPLTEGGERGLPAVPAASTAGQAGVIITVSDNGPGIPDDIKEKIFQPFFTTKPTGEGTGLGLSLSYDIVTKGHGGELSIDTSEWNGASFIIILPIQAKS